MSSAGPMRERGACIFVCTTGVGTPPSERIVTDRLAGAELREQFLELVVLGLRKRPHRRA